MWVVSSRRRSSLPRAPLRRAGTDVPIGCLTKLTPRELPGAALALARTDDGTNYTALGAAAAAARGSFNSAATPADWAQLWHALALVRHRPDDALVRYTAAALTKQQQYGSATA